LRLARILRALYIKTIIKSAGARLEPRSGGGELEASEGQNIIDNVDNKVEEDNPVVHTQSETKMLRLWIQDLQLLCINSSVKD